MAKRTEATEKPEANAKNNPNSVAANREARLARTASGRIATIRAFGAEDGDKDPREEVINIGQFEPGHRPDLGDLEAEGNKHADAYSVEEVPEGVLIGMRRGGSFNTVAGFGWRDAEDFAAHGSPAGQGAARLEDMGAH
jgi:hypothetical protein